jgi:hypothetical protein
VGLGVRQEALADDVVERAAQRRRLEQHAVAGEREAARAGELARLSRAAFLMRSAELRMSSMRDLVEPARGTDLARNRRK